MDGLLFFAIISGVLAVVLLILLLLQQRRCRRLRRQIAEFEQRFQEQVIEKAAFSQDLVAAELKRPQPKVPAPQGLPDRYRYINGMAEQGLQAGQIASILQMGEAEIAQIVRLSLLKKEG